MSITNKDYYHLQFKVSVVGDTETGKSSLVQAVFENDEKGPDEEEQSSLGINFQTKIFEEQDAIYAVQFWDAPGSEAHLKVTSRYCAGAAGIILVYDVTSRVTFDHLEEWLRESRTASSACKLLIGNKVDLEEKREVPQDVAVAFAKKHDMQFYEVSATEQIQVSDAISALVNDIIRSIPVDPEPSLLLRRGMKIGRLLTDNPRYRQSLYMELADTTEDVDWV